MGLETKIHPQVLKLWRIRGFMNSLPLVVVTLLYNFLFQIMPNTALPEAGIYITIGVTIIGGFLLIYVVPTLNYQSWRVEYKKDEIDFVSGILIKKRVTIPLIRIQNIESNKGPLTQKMGLMSLIISTAANSHKLPEMPDLEAIELQKRIQRLIQHSL
ncbi:PH domain-containing protein [Carnobacterium jeotgali]